MKSTIKNASFGKAGMEAERDKMDAVRYRKYRSMVMASLVEPVSIEQFDADIDAAIVPVEVLQNPSLPMSGSH